MGNNTITIITILYYYTIHLYYSFITITIIITIINISFFQKQLQPVGNNTITII